MEAAVRFQAQEQMPMPLDQAVLEHQVVGGVAAEEGGAAQVDVVVVAARRDMVASFVEPIRRAGLEPVGVDLSAFAMIRALADAGGRAEDGRAGRSARPERSSTAASAMSPTSPSPAVASCLFTRVSHVGLEAIAARLAALARSDRRARRPVALLRRPRASGRGDRGRPGDDRRGAARARGGRRPRCSTSCASRSTTTAPRKPPCRSAGSSSAARAAPSPAWPARMEAGLGLPDRRRPPAGAGGLRRGVGGAPDLSLRPRPGGLRRCAPST